MSTNLTQCIPGQRWSCPPRWLLSLMPIPSRSWEVSPTSPDFECNDRNSTGAYVFRMVRKTEGISGKMKSKKQSPGLIKAMYSLLAIVRAHLNLHRILSFTHALNISIITINIQYHFRRGLVQARQVSLQSTTFQLTLWSPTLALGRSIPHSRGMIKVDEEVGKDGPCSRLAAPPVSDAP